MSLSSAYGAQLAKDLGFARIVPARELSLEEIISIKKKANIELKHLCTEQCAFPIPENVYSAASSEEEAVTGADVRSHAENATGFWNILRRASAMPGKTGWQRTEEVVM